MYSIIKKQITLVAALVFVAVAPFGALIAQAQQAEDSNVAWHDGSDKQMKDAIKTARTTLPAFWDAKNSKNPKLSEFIMKVGFETSVGGVEHIWVESLSHDGDVIKGILANDPVDIPNKVYQDAVKFTAQEVTDWSYTKDGKMIGHFTTRVLLKQMSDEEAAPYWAMMGENP